MDNSYLWLKSLHLLGVVLLLGNIIVTGWWKFMADRTRNPQIIAFAQRQVTITDYLFTASGAAIILAAGWGNAASHGMDVFHTKWLSWGLWLFSASGVIWVALLIPIQHRQQRMAKAFAVSGDIPPEYWRLCKQLAFWGTIATLLPLMNLYWMVFKPV
ncbi:MAG: DUF2269 family protein [Gallionellaceae bacterium]